MDGWIHHKQYYDGWIRHKEYYDGWIHHVCFWGPGPPFFSNRSILRPFLVIDQSFFSNRSIFVLCLNDTTLVKPRFERSIKNCIFIYNYTNI